MLDARKMGKYIIEDRLLDALDEIWFSDGVSFSDRMALNKISKNIK